LAARTRTARIARALLLASCLGASAASAEFYRYVDEQGVVHLTDSPADRRYSKYRPILHGSGKGINIIARLEARRRHERDREVVVANAAARSRPDPGAYDALIQQVAGRYQVPAALVKAVMKTESNFQRTAVSRKGALGLMQLMPETAQDLGVSDPFSAEDNVWGGTRYLRGMMDRYGDWKHALAAYNAGPGAVDQYGGIPPYPETREYVERVLHYYRRYDGDFDR
jgi:soluble lytic murein transglycosylase-like protein